MPTTGDGWLERATEVIGKRINTYAASEVRFNLMALCSDRMAALGAELAAQEAIATSSAEAARGDAQQRIAQLQVEMADERDKRARWAFENAMRRHNNVSLMHALLLELAKAGKLDERIAAAKKTAAERKEKRRAAQKG